MERRKGKTTKKNKKQKCKKKHTHIYASRLGVIYHGLANGNSMIC